MLRLWHGLQHLRDVSARTLMPASDSSAWHTGQMVYAGLRVQHNREMLYCVLCAWLCDLARMRERPWTNYCLCKLCVLAGLPCLRLDHDVLRHPGVAVIAHPSEVAAIPLQGRETTSARNSCVRA